MKKFTHFTTGKLQSKQDEDWGSKTNKENGNYDKTKKTKKGKGKNGGGEEDEGDYARV